MSAQKLAYKTAWRNRNKETQQRYSRVDTLRKYGLRPADYENMYQAQEGRCAICSTWHDRLHVDHQGAWVRALLCGVCNRGLGMFQDNPELLRQAALYVEAFQE